MSTLPLYKRILYSTAFCAYRYPTPRKIECRHPFSFRVCDLDLCPIVQENFANVVFQEEGIVLLVKRLSKEKVAGEWRRVPLKITLDNEEEVLKVIEKEAEGVSSKNMQALKERIHRIYERYRFLKERGKEIPILEENEEEEGAEEEFYEEEGIENEQENL
ncbi:MAG: hypothetical protein ACTSVA_01250 [Candidatus Njordarchaeales archaeon]